MTSTSPSSAAASQLFNEKNEEQRQTDFSNATAEIYEPSDGGKNNFLGSTQHHPFGTPVQAAYWLNIYKSANYEGTHRFDPAIQWTQEEEKKLVRKVQNRV